MTATELPIASPSRFGRFKPSWETLGLPLVVLAMTVGFAVLAQNFLAISNAGNVARQVAVLGIVGAVQTVVIISGGIDLSVGSVLAVSNVLWRWAWPREASRSGWRWRSGPASSSACSTEG